MTEQVTAKSVAELKWVVYRDVDDSVYSIWKGTESGRPDPIFNVFSSYKAQCIWRKDGQRYEDPVYINPSIAVWKRELYWAGDPLPDDAWSILIKHAPEALDGADPAPISASGGTTEDSNYIRRTDRPIDSAPLTMSDDKEIVALAVCWNALHTLDFNAAYRIVEYLRSRMYELKKDTPVTDDDLPF